jgi:protein Tex
LLVSLITILYNVKPQTRAELTKNGENESLDVFASNLKQILLMPPLKGAVVLGIDPGFLNGCKLAVVTPAGEVLDTGVIYPKFSGKFKTFQIVFL